jgi:hypothetical protein
VIARDARLRDEPFHQVSAKARRVVDRQADVLVEVEHLHLAPGHAGIGGQRVEEHEL